MEQFRKLKSTAMSRCVRLLDGFYSHCNKSVKCAYALNINYGYSFFREVPDLAAFFSLCISFFCLFDLGGAFCTFFCSLFATMNTSMK